MKYNIIMYILLMGLSSCTAQKLTIYRDIKYMVKNDCDQLKNKLEIIDKECKIKLSSEVIPINTTPFYEILDSLSLLPESNGKNSFTSANMFDLKNYKPTHKNNLFEKFNEEESKNYNIRLYCSEMINNLITCEAVEIADSINNELTFGRSVVYIFEVNENTIIWNYSKLIHNN